MMSRPNEDVPTPAQNKGFRARTRHVRATPVPPITFPESLPVSARRDEIARALTEHQVLVVCGETGSGKTTQLPKIALAMGRGWGAGGKGLIGHTQPRRIAASSVAKRIAQELGSPLGEHVGYKVRFQDRLQPGASVKLMTDGILLAETQTDPLLQSYDTLILDEAHERSLNIDFLLGYLKQLLPRRPDLKLIVTSATIDAERFAEHFAGRNGPAPVIQVSGRLYPVEVRHRPFGESREFDLNDAIGDAVDELWREGPGDVLVFLPGEREIRDAAEHLRKHHLAWDTHAGRARGGVEILPLFARLSQAEQDRVFEPHAAQRIVLATNVAETSLTVPGIRYVVDAGLARVKRYSYRSKVEQLQVEPISQAAANQRAGRCGRIANGICIRLYDAQDFDGRARFTDPEIMRSSLAGVILRMKALGLGAVEEFPFIEPPPRRAIADGYQLLAELNAVDEQNELTDIGRELSKLPLDPRVGRMILEARERQALHEVLIIASALSVQDVRDRPLEAQQAADEAHRKFDDEKSEFMGYLKLWKFVEEAIGHRKSNRKLEQVFRDAYLSPRRIREWRDIHSQLHTVVAEHGWRLNTTAPTYEQLHLAMLAGLLGNVGCKSDEDDWYLGARGIKFWRHPGAHLSKKPGRWIVAAELVETTRLFGRGIAAIEPQWIPGIAGHLLKKQLLDPHWEKKPAEVVAFERATLYGLVIYNQKRVNFGQVEPDAAREMFIRQALVAGEWETRLPFLAHNQNLVRQIEELEHKSRRQDVLVDDELIFAYYDRYLPKDVHSGFTFERWYREVGEVGKAQSKLLWLSREELMRHEAAGVTTTAFPKTIKLGGIDCSVSYTFDPGNPKDGVTVTVPIYGLNQINEERCEWLVPGMLKDKVTALVKSLPQKPRSRLVPLPDYVDSFVAATAFGDGSLLDRVLASVRTATQLDVKRADFKLDMLQPHLFMNFRVVDEHGRQLATGRGLAKLKAELGTQARSAFQQLAALKPRLAEPAAAQEVAPMGALGTPTVRENRLPHTAPGAPVAPPAASAGGGETADRLAQRYTAWTFGELPELMEVRRGGQTLVGFPALIDKGDGVEIEVFDEPELAMARHRAGLRRLFALQMREPLKYLEKSLPDLQRMAVAYMALGTQEELRDQILELALDRAFLQEPRPADEAGFKVRCDEGRARLSLIAQEVARLIGQVVGEYAAAARKLKDTKQQPQVTEDIQAQLQHLMPKRFVTAIPYAQLQHLPRYLKAIQLRLDKLRTDPARDQQKLAELRPLEQRYWRLVSERKGVVDARMDELRWMLEELRVSFFAQELRTPQPISIRRIEKAWAQLLG